MTNTPRPQSDQGNNGNINRNLESNGKSFSSIHYIPGTSKLINQQLNIDHNSMKVTYKPTKTLRKAIYSKTKQKVATSHKSGVVYNMNCTSCDKCHIGHTAKKLEDRIKRHKYDYSHRYTLDTKTAAITHTIDSGHVFNFDQVSILQSEPIKLKREIKESSNIFIHNKTAVNRKTDLNNLNQDYYDTLKVFANISKLSPLKKENRNNAPS